MNNIDLQRYKMAWKHEKGFQTERLSSQDIYTFMQSTSSIVGQYKRVVVFDIIFKALLLLAYVLFIIFFPSQSIAVIVNGLFFILTLIGLIWQANIYKNMSEIRFDNQNLVGTLRMLIRFNNQHFVKSIFISALSSTLLFLSGSMYYLQFKYGQIPSFDIDDFIVMSVGIVLSYGLSAGAQTSQHNYKMKQLETCLVEIEENTIDENFMKKQGIKRMINTILIGVSFIVGVTLLLLFIYKLNT